MKKPLLRLYFRMTSYNLGPKLFFSHLTVALAAIAAYVCVSVLSPHLFGNLLAITAAAATAALVALFVSGRIARPVGRMLAATRRVSTGRYDERVPVSEPDEIGALSESFNNMAAALEEGERHRREFVADVSHELKTPLYTLRGYLEGLMDGVFEPSEETWGILYAEAERMRRLVDDLGQLSRAETGVLALRLTPIIPERTVRRAVEGMRPLFVEEGVELVSSVPAELPRALADAERVAQVLTNLLSNALRHTPAGGTVTVSVRARGAEVLFEVNDTGEGVAIEHLPRLFDRFYRVEKSRSREEGGSGLGLAICRALVEAMGGCISARSAGPGRGATLAFALPVAQ